MSHARRLISGALATQSGRFVGVLVPPREGSGNGRDEGLGWLDTLLGPEGTGDRFFGDRATQAAPGQWVLWRWFAVCCLRFA